MAKLYFYYSAMNAGKSTNLLQASYNYKERGLDTILLTPALDDRFSKGIIHSRIGIHENSNVFKQDTNLYDFVNSLSVKNISCILIDEAQFLTKKQVNELTDLVDNLDIPIMAYGLRTDYMGEPFEGSKYLLALADNLSEIKTICHCGKKAIMSMRVDKDGKKVSQGQQIHIGGNESYISTCRKHYKLGE